MKEYLKALIAPAIVALVVAVVVGLVGNQLDQSEDSLGNTRYPNGLETGKSLIYTGDGQEDLHVLSLGSGEIVTSYTNNNAFTEFTNLSQIITDGTASSSFDAYLFASSSATIPASHDFTELVPGSNSRLLVSTYATSTSATTTNSIVGVITGGTSSSDGFVEIKAGESVLFALQPGDFSCVAIPAANGCEIASSSVRGFNLTALFSTWSTSTVQAK